MRAALAFASSSVALALTAATAVAQESPTWANDVAPIVYRHCTGCHRDGGAAPFSLTGYDDARSRAHLIAKVTASGYMPPWLPAPGPPFFAGERRLQPDEVAMLVRWVAAGAPAGDLGTAPAPPPVTAQGWRLGTPDLVVEVPEPFTLPATGDDVFRDFVLPVDLGGATRRWVRAVEIVPGQPRLVHHGTLMVDRTDSSRRLDAADAAPGFDGMQAFSRARVPDGQLVGWTPGMEPSPGAEELAWELAAGTDLVLELHLLPSGRAESVGARVGLYFASSPGARRPLALRLGAKTIDIAAGEATHVEEDRYVLPVAIDLLAVYPHAHRLCRSMRAAALLPDGSSETLLDLPAWDFDWQDQYRYRDSIRLPAGTELSMRYLYDNSPSNPRNPHQPPRRVVYGPSSDDEMGDLWLQVAPVDGGDFDRLARALDARESEANVAGWRAALARAPNDAVMRFNLGSELVLAGALDDGIAELERAIALDPGLGGAHTNLGNALSARAQRRPGVDARRDLELAAEHFARAAAASASAESPDAYFNLGNTLAALGRWDEAHRAYDRALELRPTFAEARLNQAIALARQGRPDQAIAAIERCLDEQPAYVAALWNLTLLRGGEAGGLERALERVDRGLAARHESAQLQMLRGDLLLRLGRFEEAAVAYRAVLAMEARSAEAWANLGRALLGLGRRDEARDAVDRALAIDAANPAAAEVGRELAH